MKRSKSSPKKYTNRILIGDWIEQLKKLPAGIYHCVITSPPYWGQRLYGWGGNGSCDKKEIPHIWQKDGWLQTCKNCGAKAPMLGLEKTPEEHIEKLVEGFREVRRVMRDDAVLFLNYGDKYTAGGRQGGYSGKVNSGSRDGKYNRAKTDETLPDGNLIGLAWRLALALQADGWILRSDIIWAKALSMCDEYSGSTMPESINGTRWERCRVKVKGGAYPRRGDVMLEGKEELRSGGCVNLLEGGLAQWKDCPGCPKCEKNDGLVLRKGSWRPTRGHEYLFQFTKGSGYFCDMEAVREENHPDGREKTTVKAVNSWQHRDGERWPNPSGRNLRDVWAINPQSYPDSHYATFPEKLVEPCIKVATSQKGCCSAKIKKLRIRNNLQPSEMKIVKQYLEQKGLI